MPEYSEVLASVLTVLRWLQAIRTAHSDADLPILYLWTDATKKESDKAKPRTSRAAQGLVYRMDSSACSKLMRGSSGSQQYLWPRVDGVPLDSIEGFTFKGIEATPRTIVLDLGVIYLQLRLHIHMVSQVYTKAQWHDEIAMVDVDTRKFRVGLGLEMEEWVIAFLTADNVFTPHWARTKDALPVHHPDVYTDYYRFLEDVAGRVRQHLPELRPTGPPSSASESEPEKKKKEKKKPKVAMEHLAINWVRDSEGIGGVGVYMSEEIFFLAGLSVFLSEEEFFRCPSRVARFCEAYWTLAERAHAELSTLLQPCYVGYVLAPTKEQRLRYRAWLNVHAKMHVTMPARMKTLWEDYSNIIAQAYEDGSSVRRLRDARNMLYDVFEPTYIRSALEKRLNLRHLIFGEPPPNGPLDPLTQVYQEAGESSVLQPTDWRDSTATQANTVLKHAQVSSSVL
ncbi:hypothetical protein BV20DRAFT_963932 [Pilatotrama ljubarskyi]|nr:hypothetical protein BV20DRAFT_963932 [Pilatotrama ljubarskyi]